MEIVKTLSTLSNNTLTSRPPQRLWSSGGLRHLNPLQYNHDEKQVEWMGQLLIGSDGKVLLVSPGAMPGEGMATVLGAQKT